MKAVLNHSIALIGNSNRWATELRSAFGESLRMEHYDDSARLAHGHAFYLIDISDLMALSNEYRLSLVADGVINASNLVVLEEDKLLFVPKAKADEGFEQALLAIFKPKLPQLRNPLVPQLWAKFMSEPEVLACQRLCKHIQLETEREGISYLIDELRQNMHLIQETQEQLKQLLMQLSKHKVVSWEARQLLDSANALLMVNSLTALHDFGSRLEEEQEYRQLVQQTLCKFAEQLSAALFRYNEGMAFHWFFTEQKIHLPAVV